MDMYDLMLIDLLVLLWYPRFPRYMRPTSWWGWMLFVILLWFTTPIVALPVSMFFCILADDGWKFTPGI